ncbi:hypothetical protein FHS55_002162 [Angulomicrobium tetraedrale]|uniref:Uncharacterized protein n=1 Tax=Ancylobacter tetraedralis TaxID=217068 RepID=A0A839ZA02_9HYPH|nr:hypothetical protein [Ancylobacter tetraedralis]MBB3771563.1 hypothetical protein [Ancylobacter tetraedralis]
MSPRIHYLARTRARLAAAYAACRKAHRPRRTIAAQLKRATTQQLAREIAEHRARANAPARPAEPDLFTL